MSKTIKWVIYIGLSIALLFIGATIYINLTIKKKVENFIASRLPSHISQSYESLNINVLEGTITIKQAAVAIKNQDNDEVHTFVKVEQLIIEDVSYFDYIFKDEIHLEDIKLQNPQITYFKNRLSKSRDTIKKASIKIYKPIIIDELSIDHTTLHIFDDDKETVALYAQNTTIEIDDIEITAETIRDKIPFRYSNFEASGDSIFVKANNYDNLSTRSFKIKDKKASIEAIEFATKYKIESYDKMLKKERDHYQVSLQRLTLDGFDFEFTNGRLYATAEHITAHDPIANIYRNKLIADDLSTKKLYSAALRELPFQLAIDAVKLVNGSLTYAEKVKTDEPPGQIKFTSLNASIGHVDNRNNNKKKTQILIDANFMDVAPLKVDWSFDIHNSNDPFLFKMDLGKLEAPRLNSFTEPNLNVRLTGTTEKTYATIDGSSNSSHVTMRMRYEDFEVNILNKNGKKKNKLISAIANIFISKNSDGGGNTFREGSGTVTPDKTKSFFNYLWLNLQKGLLATLVGDGKAR